MDIERILVTPRWGGSIEDDWYPWLARTLGEPPVRRVPLPEKDAPTPSACVKAFTHALEEGDPGSTLCVGHSVSVHGWLRALEEQPENEVAGLVAVAGWWDIDEPWPELEPWLDYDYDFESIRKACTEIDAMVSTDDPYTRDFEYNARLWFERLNAEISIIEDAGHFNGSEEPDILEVIGSWT